MKTYGYRPPQTPFVNRLTLHRALVAGTGFAEGDILSLTEVVNQTTGAIVASYWKNEDTQVLLATAPTDPEVEALDGLRVIVGSEILPVTNTAVTLASVPVNANLAEIHVFNTDIIYNVDGTAPDEVTFDGYRENDGNTFELESTVEISQFQIKAIGTGTGSIKVTYFKEYAINA